jgi:dimeric dUTPase (all-alpha-NTP-PPase superfamily)
MIANIKDLIPIQQEVNSKVKEKLSEDISSEQFILAFNIELFEYFNAIGIWKWWKHSHKINREKILDELADCFAFFLSLVDLQNEIALHVRQKEIIDEIEDEINHYLNALNKHKEETEGEFAINEIINDLIIYVGTDNEVEGIYTTERFSIAIYIATLLFEGITWEEIAQAYKQKSEVNIQRQVENY